MPPPALTGTLCVVLGAVSFACSLVLARVSYDHGSNPQSVLVVRFVLLAAMLLLWNRWRGQSIRLPQKLVTGSLLIGLTYFIGIGSYLASVAYIPVSLAVLIFYTYPILVTLLSAGLNRSWPHPLQLIALLMAFAGLILALDVQTTGLQSMGLIFAMLAALGVTLNMIGSNYLLQQIPLTVFSFYMSIGTLLASLVALFVNSDGLIIAQSAAGAWAFTGMLIAFFIGYLAIYNGIRLIGAVPTSTIMNLEPIATILIAVVLLGELLTQQQLLGGAIVLSGILMAQWHQLLDTLRKH